MLALGTIFIHGFWIASPAAIIVIVCSFLGLIGKLGVFTFYLFQFDPGVRLETINILSELNHEHSKTQ